MSCSNCGSSSGCGCVNASQVILQQIPVARQGCAPCATPNTPTPFYQSTQQCAESNCQPVIINQFNGAICTTYNANMPIDGGTVSVYFIGLIGLPVGSYIWNQTFGYLEV